MNVQNDVSVVSQLSRELPSTSGTTIEYAILKLRLS